MKSLWNFLSIITSYMILRKWILRCAPKKIQGLGRGCDSASGVLFWPKRWGLGFDFYDFADFYDGAHSLFHCLNGNVFVATVHVHAACKDVGAWQTFE